MFCIECGKKLVDGSVFCSFCGTPQPQKAPAASVTSTPEAVNEEDLDATVGAFGAQPSIDPVPEPVYEEELDATIGAFSSFKEKEPTPIAEDPTPLFDRTISQTTPPEKPPFPPPVGKAHNGSVGFGKAVALFFKNYFNFKDRASKSEYWWAYLFNVLMNIPILIISSAVPPLGGLFSVALMIPGLAITVRRLHDVGKSGGYIFISLVPIAGPILLLIELLKDSDNDNRWGLGPVKAPRTDTYVSPTPKAITDNDVCLIAQNHEPINLNTQEAKYMMDSALNKIIPTFTGIENLAGSLMLCDPQTIQTSIAATDTDTLIIIFKALGYHMGQGTDPQILGPVQQYVLSTLKQRL